MISLISCDNSVLLKYVSVQTERGEAISARVDPSSVLLKKEGEEEY